jgi:hypothetical protein
MYNGLRYLEEKFPYFFDFSEGTNNEKIAHIMHHEFKDLLNDLEAIRNGYYFLEDVLESDLTIKNIPAIAFENNEVTFRTTGYNLGDEISFYSKEFGNLGTVKLERDVEDLGFTEHISIETIDDYYNITVTAVDIKEIKVYDLDDETVNYISFDFRQHQLNYELTVMPNTHAYKVIVRTWKEYTYTSYSNQTNEDLDIIGTMVGCSRRNYKEEIA